MVGEAALIVRSSVAVDFAGVVVLVIAGRVVVVVIAIGVVVVDIARVIVVVVVGVVFGVVVVDIARVIVVVVAVVVFDVVNSVGVVLVGLDSESSSLFASVSVSSSLSLLAVSSLCRVSRCGKVMTQL